RANEAALRLPGDAEDVALDAARPDHEGVAQHLPDRARLDIGALRREPLAAALVPIFEQSLIGRVFHFAPPAAYCASACPRSGQDDRALSCLRETEQGACRDGVRQGSARTARALALNPARRWHAVCADVGSSHQIPGEWGM